MHYNECIMSFNFLLEVESYAIWGPVVLTSLCHILNSSVFEGHALPSSLPSQHNGDSISSFSEMFHKNCCTLQINLFLCVGRADTHRRPGTHSAPAVHRMRCDHRDESRVEGRGSLGPASQKPRIIATYGSVPPLS